MVSSLCQDGCQSSVEINKFRVRSLIVSEYSKTLALFSAYRFQRRYKKATIRKRRNQKRESLSKNRGGKKPNYM